MPLLVKARSFLRNIFLPHREDADFRPSNKSFDTYFYDISPGYLSAAGTPLLAGRDVSYSALGVGGYKLKR